MDSKYDYYFKVTVVGDSAVGKSVLLRRYVDGDSNIASSATVGLDFKTKFITVEGETIKAQFWDTAGQERYQAITRAYYRGADGVLLIYDISSQESFQNLEMWLHQIREHAREDVVIALVGNKTDLRLKRVISSVKASKFADDHGLSFIEVSALDNSNVDFAFRNLLQEICRKKKKAESETTSRKKKEADEEAKRMRSAVVRVDKSRQRSQSRESSSCC